MRYHVVGLLGLTTLLTACAMPFNLGQQHPPLSGEVKDIAIAFYPSTQGHGIRKAYHPLTPNQPPQDCTQTGCGLPLIAINTDHTPFTANVAGMQGRVMTTSPNNHYLLFADYHATFRAHGKTLIKHPTHPETGSIRNLAIRNDGQFASISHIGAQEINGQSNFASNIITSNGNTTTDRNQLIDGSFITCKDNVYLISAGDEDKTNHYSTEYKYDWNSTQFIPLRERMNKNVTIPRFVCNNTSFKYESHSDSDSNIGEWIEDKGFQDFTLIGNHNSSSLGFSQSYGFVNDKYLYTDSTKQMHAFDTKDGHETVLWDLDTKLPDLDTEADYDIVLQDTSAFVFGKQKGTTNKWLTAELDAITGETRQLKTNPLLEQHIGQHDIQYIIIPNPTATKTWITTLPNLKP